MTQEQFRERVWDCLFEAEYQARYWRIYEAQTNALDCGIRVALAIAAASSLLGLFIDPKYQWWSALVGSVTALISSVILPSLDWDETRCRIRVVRHSWVDVRRNCASIYDDIDDAPQAALERKFKSVTESVDEIEKFSLRLPALKGVMEKAYAEARAHLKV
jgi:hypothetical protein